MPVFPCRRAALAAGAVLALAGCATAGPPGERVRPATSSDFSHDEAYIQTVETRARVRNIDVRWVNPPVVRRAESGE